MVALVTDNLFDCRFAVSLLQIALSGVDAVQQRVSVRFVAVINFGGQDHFGLQVDRVFLLVRQVSVALLQQPCDPACAAGVIFFNNFGYLGMCGHGLIGVVETLAFLGRITAGEHRFETSVGVVSAILHDDRTVSINNVISYRHRQNVEIDVPNEGTITGDIAWGGNWFFLVGDEDVALTNIAELLTRSRRIMAALVDQQITGSDGGKIDHVELFGEPSDQGKADSRSFVLCPGGEYDRSPCGTGTSPKRSDAF